MDTLGDYNETAKLQETFDSLAERIDSLLPKSLRPAFEEWRRISCFIIANTFRGNPDRDDWIECQRVFQRLADGLKSHGITLIP